MKRVLSAIFAVVLLIACIPLLPIQADAAIDNSAQTVVNIASSQVGSSWPRELCLGYVATVFNQAFGFDGNVYSSCCAYQNGNRYISSSSRDIPLGACVYFGGSKVVCGCGNYAGHAAIYVGNNNVVHAWDGVIVCTSIDYVINCGYPYRGYGWYANFALTDETITYDTIEEGRYAIKSDAAGAYVTVLDNKDVTGQNIHAMPTKTGFEIKKSTTTAGYSIRPLCSSSRMVNVYTQHVASGENVCLWDDTGHVSQRWYFEEVSGGYVIRSVQTPSCVLTVKTNGDICVSTYSELSTQIWKLEKYCESHEYSNGTCIHCGDTPEAAKITKQPAAVSVVSGVTAKTSVTASGDGLKYQWYFKDTTASGYSKSSITTNTYSAEMNSWRNGRKVYCLVTDKYGNSVKSNVVTLSMANPLKITKQPTNAVAPNGSQVKTTITVTGDGLKYEWYIKNKGSSTWGKSSLTGNSYYVTAKSTTNGRQVYCVVKDKYGNSVKSNVVTLSMGNPAKIATQPKNAVAPNGQKVTTTLKATGDGLKYTWYIKNAGSSTWSKSSLTGNSYYVTMKDTTKGRQIYCIVTDKYGTSVKSDVVTLSMATPLKITKQPVNASAANGSQVKTTLTATGDGLKYEWYFKNAGSSTWSKSSLTGSSYYVTMKSTTKNRQVYCIVTDKYGNSVISNIVTLNMK